MIHFLRSGMNLISTSSSIKSHWMQILPPLLTMSGSHLKNGRRKNALEFEHFNFVLSVSQLFHHPLKYQRPQLQIFFHNLTPLLQSRNMLMLMKTHQIYFPLILLHCLLQLHSLLKHLRFGGVLNLTWDNARNRCFNMKYLMLASKQHLVPINIKPWLIMQLFILIMI